jgi:hypothetical protein
MRSISCMVCAVKYDSPHRGQDHSGIPSITSSERPVPKLRVTRRNCGLAPPHVAQTALCGIDRDDVEDAREADFDDGLCFAATERDAADDDFRFIGFLVFLPFDNAASEDDVLEVENSKAVVFHFLCGMQGNDVPQCAQ